MGRVVLRRLILVAIRDLFGEEIAALDGVRERTDWPFRRAAFPPARIGGGSMPISAQLRPRGRTTVQEGGAAAPRAPGRSQEPRRQSHQPRSGRSQKLRLGISPTPLRTGGQDAESQEFRPSGKAVQRSTANPVGR